MEFDFNFLLSLLSYYFATTFGSLQLYPEIIHDIFILSEFVYVILLWPPYVIGQAIIFCPVVSSSFFFFFFA